MAEGRKVLYEKKGHVAYITLNRPERLNALDGETQGLLKESIVDAREDDSVWTIIVTGSGDRAFCAGLDLKAAAEIHRIRGGAAKTEAPYVRATHEMFLETYKPIIAGINGYCLGGGMEMALACDIRIAAANASLGMIEARRGQGGHVGIIMLPRLIPRGIALQALFTARTFTAQEALEVGLVNEVVPLAELMPTCERIAAEILECAPLSVRRMKEMIYKGEGLPPIAALRLEVGPDVYHSEDRREGARAFAEKRKPVWKNR